MTLEEQILWLMGTNESTVLQMKVLKIDSEIIVDIEGQKYSVEGNTVTIMENSDASPSEEGG